VVAAVAVSVVRQADGWLQELELLLRKAVKPSDENVVVASWNWDQKVHPLQTDHDQEVMNNGERLQMLSLPEFHYTATDTEIACEYELPHLILLKNTNSRIYNSKL
jgi:hypothetical protein